MAVTLLDIAKRLNVSPQAVSAALRERSAANRISAELREKVRATAAEMGYRPHMAARALKRQATGLFTISCAQMRDPRFIEAILMAEEAIRDAGYVVSIVHPEEGQGGPDNLVYQVSDAILHLSNWTNPVGLGNPTIPSICVFTSQPSQPFPYYSWDDSEGATLIASHLAAYGHKRVALIAGGLTSNPSRVVNMQHRLAEVGIESFPFWREDEPDLIRCGAELMERALARHPGITAAVGRNDMLTLGAYQWCLRASIAIPDRLSLMSYRDSSLFPSFAPSISAVRAPLREATLEAARTLITHIKEGAPLAQSRNFCFTLEARDSTGKAPCR